LFNSIIRKKEKYRRGGINAEKKYDKIIYNAKKKAKLTSIQFFVQGLPSNIN